MLLFHKIINQKYVGESRRMRCYLKLLVFSSVPIQSASVKTIFSNVYGRAPAKEITLSVATTRKMSGAWGEAPDTKEWRKENKTI